MISLGKISLGKMSLGAVSVGKIGTASGRHHSANIPLSDKVLAKLKREKPAIYNSLVAWYSPNLQGLTNAELATNAYLYVDGLKDLSGNGHHMTIYNMSGVEGNGSVDGDGNLAFDGSDDWAEYVVGEVKTLDDFTFITKSYKYPNPTERQKFMPCVNVCTSTNAQTLRTLAITANASSEYAMWNGRGTINVGSGDLLEVITPSMIQANNVTITPNVGSYKNYNRISVFGNTQYRSYHGHAILDVILWFDRTLTTEELTYVRTNMLVTQDIKSYVINYYDADGTFLKTENVQKGNLIPLPTIDLNATECSDVWYADIEMTEQSEMVGDEYAEEDMNLYCSKCKISDKMLEQLDEIVLDDNTTAKDHLVCWYSPKLQGLTKESVLADKVLSDLSGNEHHMMLYGFTSDEECIGSDGSLMFDEVDDKAMCDNYIFGSDFSIICDRKYTAYTNNDRRLFADRNGTIVLERGNGYVSSYGKQTPIASKIYDGVVTFTPESYNEQTIERGVSTSIHKELYIMRSIGEYVGSVIFRSFILFDLTLTANQITEVKQILKLQ